MLLYAAAFISICLGAIGQFGLKLGAGRIRVGQGILSMIASMVFNLNIVLSMFCFVTSMAIWIFVLRKLELSIAYPMVSLGYIITMALAFIFLNEPVRATKLIGTGLIIVGVIVINIR